MNLDPVPKSCARPIPFGFSSDTLRLSTPLLIETKVPDSILESTDRSLVLEGKETLEFVSLVAQAIRKQAARPFGSPVCKETLK